MLGHLVRGGNSSFRDRLIAGRFGLTAMEAILAGTALTRRQPSQVLSPSMRVMVLRNWTAAMRVGQISAVAPFRYARLIFAMAIGITVFSEVIDGWTIAGSCVIAASGLYTLFRERRFASPGPA